MSCQALRQAVEDLGVAGGAVEFQRAVEAGKHLVGLAVADLVHALGGEQRRDDLRPVGLLPGAEDVLAEVEVARLAGQAVEQHHGLQHAGGRHAHVLPGLDDVALAGLIAEGLAQQIAHAAAGGQRLQVAGVAHVGDQADEVVLVRPHVPFGPAVLVQVGAQVAVVELALDQFGGHVIELLAQGRVAGVDPGQRGGVQPFADVLAVPGLPARAFAIALQQARRVQLHQPVGFVGLDARCRPSRSSAPGPASGSPAGPG